MSKKFSIVIECPECNGTGLHKIKNTGVKCVKCNGRGALKFAFTTYTGRKKMRGIKKIAIDTVSGEISYEEFEKMYPPAPVISMNISC